ncbi:MAG: ABC transporter permease [Bacillota bacterium]
MLPLLRFVNLRHLTSRLGRTALTVSGIALGVAMIMAVLVMNRNIHESYRQLFSDLAGRADIEISASTAGGMDEALLSQVEGATGVRVALPTIRGRSVLSARDRSETVFVLGVDPGRDAELRDYQWADGRMPAAGAAREVVLTDSLASGLGVQPGDDVTLLTATGRQTYRLVGTIGAAGPGRVNLGRVAVVPLAAAQDMLGKTGRVDTIDVMLSPAADAAAVTVELAGLATGARVGKPEGGSEMDDIMGSVNLLMVFASAISLFASAFLIFNNVSMSVAERRTQHGILRALGLTRQRLLGLGLAEALLLGLVGSGVGVLLGSGLAQAMVVGLSRTMEGVFRFNPGPGGTDAAATFVALIVGVGTTVAAALRPLTESAGVQPVEAMRPGAARIADGDHRGLSSGWRTRALLGSVLVLGGAGSNVALLTLPDRLDTSHMWILSASLLVALFGLILLLEPLTALLAPGLGRASGRLFGVPGRLGAGNLARSPGRTAATAGALLVAVSMFVGVGGMSASFRGYVRDWVETAIGWDLLVSSSWNGLGAETPMSPDVGKELAEIPGVALASPERFTFVDYRGTRVLMSVLVMNDFPSFASFRVAEGPPADRLARELARHSGVAISRTLAQGQGLHPGDALRLSTPKGDRDFRVSGVVNDWSTATGTIYMDRGWYLELWDDPMVDSFAVNVADAPVETVRQAISDHFQGRLPLTMQTNAEFASSVDRTINESYLLIQALVLVALLVAALGVANTLIMSASERQREIAELRAVGADRRQVGRMVLVEALAIGLVGCSLGMLAGVVLAVDLVLAATRSMGLAFTLVIPLWVVPAALAVGLLGAPLAGWGPARYASAQPICVGMRYE